MDDLVLLAQVHGSGPATVEMLRAKGIQAVRDVAALDPEELAQASGLTTVAARRMSAEARRMVHDSSIGSGRDETVPERESIGNTSGNITVVKRAQRQESDAEVGVGRGEGQSGKRATHARTPTDEGVSAEEASVLSRPARPVAPAAEADDPARTLPSFFRFG